MRCWLSLDRALTLGSLLTLGCTREADIYDEPPMFVPPPMPTQAETPSVPGLDLEEFPACSERPEGDCRGVNDFPCAFGEYAQDVINACFFSTDCRADGWVSVELGEDGCLADIGMEHVDLDFAECVEKTLGPSQCPCGQSRQAVFLGADNDGCDEGPDG